MLAQFIAFVFVFVTCGAQEHLTCLRTDDLLAPSPPTTNVRIQQGRPGRIGPPGPIGLRGLKGEPGIPDNSLIDSLRANLTATILRGYMEMQDGWIAPFNGYQYKVAPSQQSWSASRTACQQRGGDLAQYGVRDVATRITLYRGLSLSDSWYWIGLSDVASEGTWVWLNGNRANDDDGSLWLPGYPTTSGASDCVIAYFSGTHSFGTFVRDHPCRSSFLPLCEKEV